MGRSALFAVVSTLDDCGMDASFESAVDGLRQTGASALDQELVKMLADHAETEGALLEKYRRFAEESGSPAVRYLVGLILEDEQRHHRLLGEIANAVAWGWSDLSPASATPDVDSKTRTNVSIGRLSKELLAAENRDRSDLRRLRKELRPYKDTTLWSLIVELMMLDTEKHSRILSFVSRHLD